MQLHNQDNPWDSEHSNGLNSEFHEYKCKNILSFGTDIGNSVVSFLRQSNSDASFQDETEPR